MAGYIGASVVGVVTDGSDVTGNITVGGTVDSRDVSVDGAKLDTIPVISTSSTASFIAKSDGTTDGYIQLNCSANSHGIKLKSPPHSAGASYTLVFPNDDGTANQLLSTNGSGVLSWTTVSSSDSTKLPLAGGAMTGAITTNSTFDGVDIATRDAVLTSTTTTAGAALPKAGGALTGAVTTNSTFDGRDVAADGVTADAALPKAGGAMTGAITTNSTFDGRDVAADGVLATNALPKSGGALTGAVTTNSTIDGRDVAADGVLATNALPKAGGAVTGNVTFGDSNKAIFGAGSDLQIYHDGSNSYIIDQGTNDLKILATDFQLKNAADNEFMMTGVTDGAVTLYHNNAVKIATAATGVAVTGNITASGTAAFAGNLTVTGTILNLPTANSYITGAGHNVFQVDANTTYLYGGGLGVSLRSADNSVELIRITNAGILSTVTPGTSNFRMGVNAGLGIQANGNYNVAVGDAAGKAITTGGYNTAVGHKALFTETAGAASTAFGAGALQRQILGNGSDSNNVGIGYVAGTKVTTGKNNVIIGRAAYNVTTASNNIAIGALAMATESTGQRSVAIGTSALATQNTTNGALVYNVAVGHDAGTSTTTGSLNTFVGGLSGDAVTTGFYNSCLGIASGGALTTGAHNVGIGDDALPTITTGNRNLSMGRYAGYGITTSGDNVCIGYTTGYAGGASNQLTSGYANTLLGNYCNVAASGNALSTVIGHSVAGKGSNTAFIGGSGGAYQQNNSTSWSTTSDRRLKKNIVDSTIGLAEINQLQVRNFEYRTEDEITELDGRIDKVDVQGVQVGVIAQEIQAILPKCVTETSQGVLTVNSDNLTWHLIKAVQELSATNTALAARITVLEGE